MGVEAREARQPWILLSPALVAITLLLFVPLGFIVVYSFWLLLIFSSVTVSGGGSTSTEDGPQGGRRPTWGNLP